MVVVVIFFPMFAYGGLVVEIQPLNCKTTFFAPLTQRQPSIWLDAAIWSPWKFPCQQGMAGTQWQGRLADWPLGSVSAVFLTIPALVLLHLHKTGQV